MPKPRQPKCVDPTGGLPVIWVKQGRTEHQAYLIEEFENGWKRVRWASTSALAWLEPGVELRKDLGGRSSRRRAAAAPVAAVAPVSAAAPVAAAKKRSSSRRKSYKEESEEEEELVVEEELDSKPAAKKKEKKEKKHKKEKKEKRRSRRIIDEDEEEEEWEASLQQKASSDSVSIGKSGKAKLNKKVIRNSKKRKETKKLKRRKAEKRAAKEAAAQAGKKRKHAILEDSDESFFEDEDEEEEEQPWEEEEEQPISNAKPSRRSKRARIERIDSKEDEAIEQLLQEAQREYDEEVFQEAQREYEASKNDEAIEQLLQESLLESEDERKPAAKEKNKSKTKERKERAQLVRCRTKRDESLPKARSSTEMPREVMPSVAMMLADYEKGAKVAKKTPDQGWISGKVKSATENYCTIQWETGDSDFLPKAAMAQMVYDADTTRYTIKTKVKKRGSNDMLIKGRVHSLDNSLYHIKYNDGSIDVVGTSEMDELVATKNRSRKSAPVALLDIPAPAPEAKQSAGQSTEQNKPNLSPEASFVLENAPISSKSSNEDTEPGLELAKKNNSTSFSSRQSRDPPADPPANSSEISAALPTPTDKNATTTFPDTITPMEVDPKDPSPKKSDDGDNSVSSKPGSIENTPAQMETVEEMPPLRPSEATKDTMLGSEMPALFTSDASNDVVQLSLGSSEMPPLLPTEGMNDKLDDAKSEQMPLLKSNEGTNDSKLADSALTEAKGATPEQLPLPAVTEAKPMEQKEPPVDKPGCSTPPGIIEQLMAQNYGRTSQGTAKKNNATSKRGYGISATATADETKQAPAQSTIIAENDKKEASADKFNDDTPIVDKAGEKSKTSEETESKSPSKPTEGKTDDMKAPRDIASPKVSKRKARAGQSPAARNSTFSALGRLLGLSPSAQSPSPGHQKKIEQVAGKKKSEAKAAQSPTSDGQKPASQSPTSDRQKPASSDTSSSSSKLSDAAKTPKFPVDGSTEISTTTDSEATKEKKSENATKRFEKLSVDEVAKTAEVTQAKEATGKPLHASGLQLEIAAALKRHLMGLEPEKESVKVASEARAARKSDVPPNATATSSNVTSETEPEMESAKPASSVVADASAKTSTNSNAASKSPPTLPPPEATTAAMASTKSNSGPLSESELPASQTASKWVKANVNPTLLPPRPFSSNKGTSLTGKGQSAGLPGRSPSRAVKAASDRIKKIVMGKKVTNSSLPGDEAKKPMVVKTKRKLPSGESHPNKAKRQKTDGTEPRESTRTAVRPKKPHSPGTAAAPKLKIPEHGTRHCADPPGFNKTSKKKKQGKSQPKARKPQANPSDTAKAIASGVSRGSIPTSLSALANSRKTNSAPGPSAIYKQGIAAAATGPSTLAKPKKSTAAGSKNSVQTALDRARSATAAPPATALERARSAATGSRRMSALDRARSATAAARPKKSEPPNRKVEEAMVSSDDKPNEATKTGHPAVAHQNPNGATKASLTSTAATPQAPVPDAPGQANPFPGPVGPGAGSMAPMPPRVPVPGAPGQANRFPGPVGPGAGNMAPMPGAYNPPTMGPPMAGAPGPGMMLPFGPGARYPPMQLYGFPGQMPWGHLNPNPAAPSNGPNGPNMPWGPNNNNPTMPGPNAGANVGNQMQWGQINNLAAGAPSPATNGASQVLRGQRNSKPTGASNVASNSPNCPPKRRAGVFDDSTESGPSTAAAPNAQQQQALAQLQNAAAAGKSDLYFALGRPGASVGPGGSSNQGKLVNPFLSSGNAGTSSMSTAQLVAAAHLGLIPPHRPQPQNQAPTTSGNLATSFTKNKPRVRPGGSDPPGVSPPNRRPR